MITHIQTRIAQSRRTLPFTALYAMAVCLAVGLVTQHLWIQVLLLSISTLLMVELNNANSMIRIYSRMVSCSFLVMATTASFLIPSKETAIIQILFIAFFLNFFKAYQNPTATGTTFYAFLAIGLISIPFIQVLFFVPILWILLTTNLLAFSARTFLASILGILAPYLFVGAYHMFTDDWHYLPTHFLELARLDTAFDLSVIDIHHLITAVFILLLAIVGSVHFLIYSYLDKIRTRMVYETFITLDVFCFMFMLLQPQHFDRLLTMAIVTTSPLIGHYLALSHTKVSNICFFVILFLAAALTVFNLWIPSTIF